MKIFRRSRFPVIRLFIIVVFIFLTIPVLFPVWTVRICPSSSPFVTLLDVLAPREWFVPQFWFLPMLAILVLGLFKGRFFCRTICPLGTIYKIFSRWSFKKVILKKRLNRTIFWFTFWAAVCGTPMVLFLDPLSTFTRLMTGITSYHFWIILIPLSVFVLFFFIHFIQPMMWCTHICPLGYSFESSIRIRQNVLFQNERREIIKGFVLALPSAFLFNKTALPDEKTQHLPVLPPGAVDQASFSNVCSRCYACVNVCPTEVIQIGFFKHRTLGQFFQPELATRTSYCDEFCNKCSIVCPTGAIRFLSLEDKKKQQIGVAVLDKESCLAWADDKFCMVCDEYCSYHAIEFEYREGRIPLPSVNKDICRGCGSCEYACPAIRNGKAIHVNGVYKQRVLNNIV